MKIKMKITKILQDATKAVLRGKFIALNKYTGIDKMSKTNNISFHLGKPPKRAI